MEQQTQEGIITPIPQPMRKSVKILSAVYGACVAFFGLFLFGGTLFASYTSLTYSGITSAQHQMILSPFFFWQGLIIGACCLISGVVTIWKPFIWLLIASISTGLYFFSKILIWPAGYPYDIIATVLCLVPYLIFSLSTKRQQS